MAWRGSLSRSLMSTARASTFRSSPPLSAPRLLRPARLNSRRLSFSNPSTLGELGCIQSLLPLHSMVAGARLTSHLAVNVRAFCELSHGIFCRSCQDR
ncbi:caspase-6 protein [Perilla frutescens var. hirtella]|uniref:Caspase-6 protein n=1 Tax=Perilla frutescens var. hirtella TaxID=608512 RepID=A0AAD4JHF5_PERFH|nr:caspase-6 protein [Perilla frutescens var. frutescens]KAH6793563.1 caspase-6 protein [Perilla frutescens var. hirtella]KAH6833160.1 caspase-6 protein [Perilla frutescens var. hirtella]